MSFCASTSSSMLFVPRWAQQCSFVHQRTLYNRTVTIFTIFIITRDVVFLCPKTGDFTDWHISNESSFLLHKTLTTVSKLPIDKNSTPVSKTTKPLTRTFKYILSLVLRHYSMTMQLSTNRSVMYFGLSKVPINS